MNNKDDISLHGKQNEKHIDTFNWIPLSIVMLVVIILLIIKFTEGNLSVSYMIIGVIGSPFVFLVLPLRFIWQCYRFVRPPQGYQSNITKLISSIFLKLIAIMILVYYINETSSSGPVASGFKDAFYAAISFLIYLASEIIIIRVYTKT